MAGVPLGFWNVAKAFPDRLAILEPDGRETTFGGLLDRVERLSHGLKELGLERGDAIAAALPNCRGFMEAELAANQSGLYFIPVNCHLAPAEASHVIADSESGVLLAHEEFAELSIAAADEAGIPPVRRFAIGDISGFRPFDDLLAERPDSPAPRICGSRMPYTSGTTGMPKGVRRPLGDGDPAKLFGRMGEIATRGFGIEAGPGVCLTCGPLHHAGPSMMNSTTLHVGHTQILMDKWTPEGCLELIERHRVTCAQMVPTMFHRLLALPEEVRERYDLSSVVSVVHTGAPCPVAVKQRMMDWWGPVIYETYGGTEGAATIARPHRWIAKPGTVGKPIHGVDLKILDDDGNEVATGEVGDIYIRSRAGQRSEYFKDPEKTRSIWRGDHFTLGDMGYVDDDGFLFLSDRKKDMIISGGVNIFPAEVEAALLSHPAVGDVAVIGVPDPEWGEQVKAIIEPATGVVPTDELGKEVIDFCRENLAHYKCPRTVDFRDELPRADNGKLYKRRIRDEYWQDTEQRI